MSETNEERGAQLRASLSGAKRVRRVLKRDLLEAIHRHGGATQERIEARLRGDAKSERRWRNLQRHWAAECRTAIRRFRVIEVAS